MKKWFAGFALAIIVLAVAFFTMAPDIVERRFNTMTRIDYPAVPAVVQQLHDNATVVDLHGDTLLWQRSILRPAKRGHIDVPRLQQGNVALQVFSSVTRSPKGLNYERNSGDTDSLVSLAIAQRQPVRTWFSPLQRSLYHASKLERAQQSSDALMIVRSVADIDQLLQARASGQPLIGAMLSIEGLHNLEGDGDNLQRLFDAGFRMAGLTHFFDNAIAGSMHGIDKGGLTTLGRQVVIDMQRLGMIIDLAHLSPAAIDDVLELATKPVVVSHGGVQALCDVNRNLPDDQIRRIAATGGIIGIGYWSGAVCGTAPADVAAAMKHVRDLVGVAHVALGSDFDGAVNVSFDTSQLSLVTHALRNAGFSDTQLNAVLGGNALRVFRQTLPER